MTATNGVRLLVLLGVVLLGVWLARNLRFEETNVELPLAGAAATNPRYALEHLLEPLGVQVQEVPTLNPPATHAVLLSNGYSRDSHGQDVDALERWVRAGGHLVVGPGGVWRPSFQRWTGIRPDLAPDDAPAAASAASAAPVPRPRDADACQTLQVARGDVVTPRTLCGGAGIALASRQPPTWRVSDGSGNVALSVHIGRGLVTVLPRARLQDNRELPRGDHARLLLDALELRHGGVLYYFGESQTENLFQVLWRLVAPGLVLLGLALLLLILRQLPRFGTPIPAPLPLRRSLAEQLRATALFAWRTRRLQSLRRAVIRGLDEAAGRQVAAYRRLDSRRRAEVLAGAAGPDAARVRSALNEAAAADPEVQRQALTTLMIARRRFMQRKSNRGLP